jgi:hypothetical protein
MVVPGVLDAVPGEEVEEDAAVFGVEFGTDATLVAHVHAEEVEQAHPLRVHIVGVRVGR